MVEPSRDTFDLLILKARRILNDVRVTKRDERRNRSLLELEGKYKNFRIIISEIRFPNGSVRYAYYVLDKQNRVVRGFDNSPDIRALKLRYESEYKYHLHERIPHAHTTDDEVELTEHYDFDSFLSWLQKYL